MKIAALSGDGSMLFQAGSLALDVLVLYIERREKVKRRLGHQKGEEVYENDFSKSQHTKHGIHQILYNIKGGKKEAKKESSLN